MYIQKTGEFEEEVHRLHKDNLRDALMAWEKKCSRLSDKVVDLELGSQMLRKNAQFFNLQHAMEKWKYGIKVKKLTQKVEEMYGRFTPADKAKELTLEIRSIA